MNDSIRTPLPDDAWGADTRRILARIDEGAEPTDEEMTDLLAYALRVDPDTMATRTRL